MFYTLIFLTFEWDEMYRYLFYTYIFLQRKISITGKMFYSKNTRVPTNKFSKHSETVFISYES